MFCFVFLPFTSEQRSSWVEQKEKHQHGKYLIQPIGAVYYPFPDGRGGERGASGVRPVGPEER